MSAHQMIHVGRVVRFEAGCGDRGGKGAIVAIHGEPNTQPPQTIGGLVHIVRADDCRVDVVLFDGRRVSDVHQCSIDRPGIGIKLTDEVLPSVDHLPALAAERDATQLIAAVKDRVEREAAEAARVITDPPVFFYNGIKDKKGAKPQKCWYSDGELRSFPAGTISIYARDYNGFSSKVHGCFEVKNDTDSQTDYFEKDTIRVLPGHPLYAQVRAALDAMRSRR